MSDTPRPNPICAIDAFPALSGQLTIRRSGEHLAKITQSLREFERLLMNAERQDHAPPHDGDMCRRSQMQSLDVILQEIAGLSDILIGAAAHLPDLPDRSFDMLVDLPRLQSLSRALRGQIATKTASETVIF